jgi:putative PIN family toxin of toxin-antitoxin system
VIRAVLDSGVLISGAISAKGTAAAILSAWYGGDLEIVVCPSLLAELRRALAYPKVRRLVPENEANALVMVIEQAAITLPDPLDVPAVCRDPNDDYLFALAREAGAVLVSGDNDILDVTDVGVRVLRPAALVSLVHDPTDG